MDSSESMIAVCGLDCGTCGIHLATDDPEVAKRLAKNFRENGIIPDAEPYMFRCDGCKGDRSDHWNKICRFLNCCVDDKGLEFCNQCRDFPCRELEDWSVQNEKYQKALDRLKYMVS